MGRPAVCGIGDVEVHDGAASATVAGVELEEGTAVAVDGDRGLIATVAPPFADLADDSYVTRLSEWRSA
jgi:pyruvate,orthophosphate dikinase